MGKKVVREICRRRPSSSPLIEGNAGAIWPWWWCNEAGCWNQTEGKNDQIWVWGFLSCLVNDYTLGWGQNYRLAFRLMDSIGNTGKKEFWTIS